MSNKYPGGIITSGANAGYSVAFDGTGDYLQSSTSTTLDLDGAINFTIEAWVYVTAWGSTADITYRVVGKFEPTGGAGYMYGMAGGGANQGKPTLYGNGGAINLVGTNVVPLNTWSHIAIVKNGTTYTHYLNGIANGSTTTGNTLNASTNPLTLAYYYNTAYTEMFKGYMSNVRIVKGTALYTAAFTPPTQLFAITNTSLLTCNSPAIVDQSSNNFTITANGNAAVSTFTPFTGTQLVPNPNTLANTQGVWSISDAAYWMSQNKWPMPPNYPLQSLRFNSADSAYLSRTPGSAGNRKTWTWSGWVKRSTLLSSGYKMLFSAGTTLSEAGYFAFGFSNDQFTLTTGSAELRRSTAVYRDVSSFYHVVVAVDTTQATAGNRVRIYINGSEVTAFGTNAAPTLNADLAVNSAVAHAIGRNTYNSSDYFDGYITDTYLIDGQALTPSSFGANDPNTGVWSPVPYSGTYGTNGFRLSFQDNTGTTATTLGKDYSGNGNNWTPNNFSVAAGSGNDSLTDGPTNWGIDYGNGGEVRGNYATFNPLVTSNPGGGYTGSTAVLSNGNLTFAGAGAADYLSNSTVAFPSSGKWYCEITLETLATTTKVFRWGMSDASMAPSSNGLGFYINNGGLVGNQNVLSVPGTSQNIQLTGLNYTQAANDVLQIAYDADTGRAWVGIKNQWVGTSLTSYTGAPASGGSPTYTFTAGTQMFPYATVYGSATTCHINFGQRPFAYPAPPGFKVLCSTNLPIPAVGATSTTLANKYFDATTYTGNGSTNTITNAGSFQPDFVWIKDRTSAYNHELFDAVRGALNYLSSSTNSAASTLANSLTAFNSNGFSLGSEVGCNANGDSFVGWQWNAGGATVTNTSGSISSQVRANTTAGFSVVTYTGTGTGGATIGHGLGKAPSMIITKARVATGLQWAVYHVSLGATKNLWLNLTDAVNTQTVIWNDTAPSSTVFTVGSAGNTNSTQGMVAYCFAEIAGFSKFGSYTGNGSADGPFIYTGFRPRWVLVKNTTAASTSDWVLLDTARSTYNLANLELYPNGSYAEETGTSTVIDILSNGFKIRGTHASGNSSGGTYIFAAFAEAPFNYSRAR